MLLTGSDENERKQKLLREKVNERDRVLRLESDCKKAEEELARVQSALWELANSMSPHEHP